MSFSTRSNILLAVSIGSMHELLSLFSSTAPATLHLAAHGNDAAWHLKNTSLDFLVLEHGLQSDVPGLHSDSRPFSAPPCTLYLGNESELASLPNWLASSATALPWPGKKESVQRWIKQNIRPQLALMRSPSILQAGPIQLDLHRLIISNGRDEVGLTSTEAYLLATLIRNLGSLVSRNALVLACLSHASDPKQRRLDTHISNLRRKLKAPDHMPNRLHIHSHRGQGYMLTIHS